MKCDHCDQEATVHEVVRKSGKTVERHLCEQCAKKQGIAVQQVPISELIHKYVLSQSGAGAEAKAAALRACPSCGTAYAEFKQSGLLGCADCYTAFESSLGPLLERAHEGGTHHVGKSPRRPCPTTAPPPIAPRPVVVPTPPPKPARSESAERAQRLRALQKQLDEAVKAEQYERAASIRDQIRALEHPEGPAGAGGGGAPGGGAA